MPSIWSFQGVNLARVLVVGTQNILLSPLGVFSGTPSAIRATHAMQSRPVSSTEARSTKGMPCIKPLSARKEIPWPIPARMPPSNGRFDVVLNELDPESCIYNISKQSLSRHTSPTDLVPLSIYLLGCLEVRGWVAWISATKPWHLMRYTMAVTCATTRARLLWGERPTHGPAHIGYFTSIFQHEW
jgi:hypothetical protein